MADHMTAAKMLPLLRTANSQIRHLIDDLTVAVDDDGLTRYVPRANLMFSNLIGALVDLAPRMEAALAAAPQPARVALTQAKCDELIASYWHGVGPVSRDTYTAFIREVERAHGIPGTDGA